MYRVKKRERVTFRYLSLWKIGTSFYAVVQEEGWCGATDAMDHTVATSTGQCLGNVSQFGPTGTLVNIDGEGPSVAIFKVRERYYAVDKFCYHHGGPLEQGDIEDLGDGKLCVICPWHQYRLNLESGEGYYSGLEGG